jgi:glycosidase
VENTKSTHEWYKEFYTFYKSGNSDVYTVGEVFGAGAFMGKTYENEFDHIFNFELASGIMLSALVGTNTPIDSAIQFTLNDKPDYSFATFLTNHDQDRAMSVLDGDMAKAKVAAFLLLTSPGTPFLYYGEEIGMQGRKPDENIRLPMQWNSSKDAGFTTGKPWRPLNTNYRDVNVEIQTDDTNSLLNHYRELIEVRNTHPALHTGTYYEVKSNDSSVFAALRVDGNETLLVVINLSDESITDYTLTLEDMVLTDGTYGAETLFGDAQVKGPSVTRGIFQNYRPINELNPFSTLIVKLQP